MLPSTPRPREGTPHDRVVARISAVPGKQAASSSSSWAARPMTTGFGKLRTATDACPKAQRTNTGFQFSGVSFCSAHTLYFVTFFDDFCLFQSFPASRFVIFDKFRKSSFSDFLFFVAIFLKFRCLSKLRNPFRAPEGSFQIMKYEAEAELTNVDHKPTF